MEMIRRPGIHQALVQGIGPGHHRLGPKHLKGPFGVGLDLHYPPDVLLEGDFVDDPKTFRRIPDLHTPPVGSPIDPDETRIRFQSEAGPRPSVPGDLHRFTGGEDLHHGALDFFEAGQSFGLQMNCSDPFLQEDADRPLLRRGEP